MTFDEIWEHLLKKDPRLSADNVLVEFRSDNLRQLLKQVFEQGQKNALTPPNPSNIFEDFLGKYKK